MESKVDDYKSLQARLLTTIGNLEMRHHTSEDCWYSCPCSGECCDSSQGDSCNCGADRHNKYLNDCIEIIKRMGLSIVL